LSARGEANNERLLYFLTIAKSEEIEQLVSGLSAQTLFDTGAAKMLSSVRGIIGSYLPSYRFLAPGAGSEAWSIRKWVEGGTDWLWIPYRDDQLPSLRPLIAAWIGEVVSSILSLRPDSNRRIWLLLDELASLGRVQSLADALTKGRKYGLRCVAGLQSVAQLRAIYGREGAQTLLSCLSSSLTLRSADAETADYLSRSLGDAEVRRENRSRGDGRETLSEQRVNTRVVMPSEIQNLPDRQGFLNLAGDFPVARVEIPIVQKPEVVLPFIPRGSVVPDPPSDGAV
jgi:type IV secretory pathway TraG/TraD family ATPase VirD4